MLKIPLFFHCYHDLLPFTFSLFYSIDQQNFWSNLNKLILIIFILNKINLNRLFLQGAWPLSKLMEGSAAEIVLAGCDKVLNVANHYEIYMSCNK